MEIDINTLIITVIAVAGIIITLGGATSVLKRWWDNSKSVKNKELIDKLTKRVEELEYKCKKIEKQEQENEDFNKIMCNSMLALLNHSITGRSTEKLKEAEEEIKSYLINK